MKIKNQTLDVTINSLYTSTASSKGNRKIDAIVQYKPCTNVIAGDKFESELSLR